MNKFIMLAGLPASGKTTYAEEYQYDGYCVVSSDKVRKELYGNEAIQGDPNQVFSLACKRAGEYLYEGGNIIFDATNIKRKDRRRVLSAIGKIPCYKISGRKPHGLPWG